MKTKKYKGPRKIQFGFLKVYLRMPMWSVRDALTNSYTNCEAAGADIRVTVIGSGRFMFIMQPKTVARMVKDMKKVDDAIQQL